MVFCCSSEYSLVIIVSESSMRKIIFMNNQAVITAEYFLMPNYITQKGLSS